MAGDAFGFGANVIHTGGDQDGHVRTQASKEAERRVEAGLAVRRAQHLRLSQQQNLLVEEPMTILGKLSQSLSGRQWSTRTHLLAHLYCCPTVRNRAVPPGSTLTLSATSSPLKRR